jgi:hypothetical protein
MFGKNSHSESSRRPTKPHTESHHHHHMAKCHTLVRIRNCAQTGHPRGDASLGFEIRQAETQSKRFSMDPTTKHQFFSACVTACLMLLTQTSIACAGCLVRPRATVPAFVDNRRGSKAYVARNTFARKDYKDNHWWRMIDQRLHHDSRTTDGRDFRKNFRVPATFFDHMVQWFRDNSWVCKDYDKFRRPSVPLELKILACFEMLGRGVPAAVPAQLIGCDQKTIQVFFLLFCAKVALHLCKEYIKFPSSVADIRECVATYADENLPGCMGSIDCVHVPWPKALASVRSWFVGKEGIPTVAFQVIVNHKRKILSVSQPHPGAHNDKTIASMDPALHAIRTLQAFITFPWTCLTAAGEAAAHGVYLICDGGYHLWRVLQRCNVVTSDPKMLFLMNRITSARKDVECTFGVVKARFRILKVAILNQELSDVRNIFMTCCIFHNMLLDHDDSGDFEDNGRLDHISNLPGVRARVSADSDFSGVQSPPPGFWLGSHAEATHLRLRSQLAEHLYQSHVHCPSSPAHRAASHVVSTPTTEPRHAQ